MNSKFLRILGCAVLACLLVFTGAGYIVMKMRRPAGDAVAQVVKGIHLISGSEFKSMLDQDNPNRTPKKRPMPPPAFPVREVSGIVQVGFTVQSDGHASNVHVLHAAPAGYYEEQAKAIVMSGYYKPTLAKDGRLLPREASTIIHFTVPAHAAPSKAGAGKQAAATTGSSR